MVSLFYYADSELLTDRFPSNGGQRGEINNYSLTQRTETVLLFF
jgi:hypothetical protein